MMGLLLLGEKRTQDAHSEWPSSCKLKMDMYTLSMYNYPVTQNWFICNGRMKIDDLQPDK